MIKSILAAALALSLSAPVHAAAPEALRSDNVYVGQTALCPNAVVTAKGDIIATFADHGDVQFGTKALFVRSADGGKTWSDVYLEFAPSDPALTGVMTCGLFVLDNNDVLVVRVDVDMPGGSLAKRYTAGIRVLRSSDDGNTFTDYATMPVPEGRLAAPYGQMRRLADGALLMPGFVQHVGNGYWLSRDDGQTWSEFRIVWTDPPKGAKKALNFNETAYELLADGTIVSVARNDFDDLFYLIESKDNGNTWTEPRSINVLGGSPALHRTANNTLLLAYRDGTRLGLGVSESTDGGKNWRYLYRLPTPDGVTALTNPRWDRLPVNDAWQPGEGYVGYPAMMDLHDGTIYAVWHLHNKNVPPSAEGRATFGLAGNVLSNPSDANDALTAPFVFPRAQVGSILRGQEKSGAAAIASLLDSADGLGLQITPLRIENRRSREAEVHTSEDDIFYVLSGEATFHLGGTLNDVREYTPGNHAGASQQGDTAYTVGAGDLIVIPRGVVHRISCPDGVVELLVIKRIER